AMPNYGAAANLIQAVLYGIVHRRLWRERDWYFLAGSVILGYAAGAATLATGSVIPAIVGHFAVTVSIFAFAGGRLRPRPIRTALPSAPSAATPPPSVATDRR